MIPIEITVKLDVTDRLLQLLRYLTRGDIAQPAASDGPASHVAPPVTPATQPTAAPKRTTTTKKDKTGTHEPVWTTERLTQLRALAARQLVPTQMLPILSALPGAPLNARSIGNRLYIEKQRDAFSSYDRAVSEQEQSDVVAPPIVIPGSIAVQRTDIEGWCRQAGIPFKSLGFVNKARAQRSLPPFSEREAV